MSSRKTNKTKGETTRGALMQAALQQVARGRSFEAMSLRKLTGSVGIVPTAFYRHFESMEALGLALVDDSLRTLRRIMRQAREGDLAQDQIIRASVVNYADYVNKNRLHFNFVLRERYGGVAPLRHAIRNGIQLFISELATDLGRFPLLNTWSAADLRMISALIVGAVMETTELLLDAAQDDAERIEEIVRTSEKQLRLVMLAVPQWRSKNG